MRLKLELGSDNVRKSNPEASKTTCDSRGAINLPVLNHERSLTRFPRICTLGPLLNMTTVR